MTACAYQIIISYYQRYCFGKVHAWWWYKNVFFKSQKCGYLAVDSSHVFRRKACCRHSRSSRSHEERGPVAYQEEGLASRRSSSCAISIVLCEEEVNDHCRPITAGLGEGRPIGKNESDRRLESAAPGMLDEQC
jgi:hypothetical protein